MLGLTPTYTYNSLDDHLWYDIPVPKFHSIYLVVLDALTANLIADVVGKVEGAIARKNPLK